MFKDVLRELFRLNAGGEGQPPVPDRVLVVEVGPNDFAAGGKPIVRSANLVEAKDYEDRFAELLGRKFPWINVSYYGVLRGAGLVAVELPGDHPGRTPSARTSVNFSGPSKALEQTGWDASLAVVLE